MLPAASAGGVTLQRQPYGLPPSRSLPSLSSATPEYDISIFRCSSHAARPRTLASRSRPGRRRPLDSTGRGHPTSPSLAAPSITGVCPSLSRARRRDGFAIGGGLPSRTPAAPAAVRIGETARPEKAEACCGYREAGVCPSVKKAGQDGPPSNLAFPPYVPACAGRPPVALL